MSRKTARQRHQTPSNRRDLPQASEVQVSPDRKSRLPIVLVLILIGSLGLWGYIKWQGPGVSDEDQQQTAEVNSGTAEPDLANPTPTALPSWQRDCSGSVCAVSQEDLAETWLRIDDAGEDGWDTEVFSDAATKQFTRLKEAITHGTLDAAAVEFLVEDQALIGRLLPTNLKTTFQDATLHVRRAQTMASAPTESVAEERRGAGGLAQSLTELLSPYTQPEALRLKIKVFRVTRDGDFTKTLQTLEVFGKTSDGIMEITAIWSASWSNDRTAPRLTELDLVEYETATRIGRTLFSDCTESALAANPGFERQLLKGFNHWLDRSQSQQYYEVLGTAGLAIGDLNGDGLEDLYYCQEEGIPNVMLIQQPDGTLVDRSVESGTNWLESSRCALIVDVNNDEHNDLVVAIEGGFVCAQGDGSGGFQVALVVDTGQDMLSSLAMADYDNDGRVDLYVGVYSPDIFGRDTEGLPAVSGDFVYYDSRAGGFNSLWRNECVDGKWDFRDVTRDVGLDKDNNRMTLATAWEDLDNDGDQDLYVANDYGPNNLYRNDLLPDGSRHFVDIAFDAGAEDSASGMAVTFSDYDHDGWMDIYVSNMFSYAGNRIMFQAQFKSDADDKVKEVFRRFARGNTLLRNVGLSDSQTSLKFEDRSLDASVNRGRWAWGSLFLDINNDSWDDLIVANGFITTEDTGDL